MLLQAIAAPIAPMASLTYISLWYMSGIMLLPDVICQVL